MTADFTIASGDVLFAKVDLGVYPLSALLRVAHRYTGRCFLHLQFERRNESQSRANSSGDGLLAAEWQAQDSKIIEVRFRSKIAGRDLAPIVGSFLNDLLDQTLREVVSAETEPVRNLILAHALADTDLLRPDLVDVEADADPLSIALPDAATNRTPRASGRNGS